MRSLLFPILGGAAIALFSATVLPWIPVLRTVAPLGAIATALLTSDPLRTRTVLLLLVSGMATFAALVGAAVLAAVAIATAACTLLPPILRVVGLRPSIRVALVTGVLFAVVEILFPLLFALHDFSSFPAIGVTTGVAAVWNIGAGMLALRMQRARA